MGEAAAQIVGKKDLCAEMGWTRPWLDRRLKSDPHFPVHKIGDQSGGWEFDLADVRRHFSGRGGLGSNASAPAPSAAKSAPKGIDLAQLRDAVKPATCRRPLQVAAEETAVQIVEALKGAIPDARQKGDKTPRRSAYHSGEASARQRKDEADAALKEDKLRESRGDLVQKSDLRSALATLMARLGHDLDALPEKIARALDLADDAVPGIRAMIDQVRTEMVKGAEPLLAQTD